MLISAITPLTLLDFPDTVACMIFTTGCNFRCGYCHNPDLVLPERIAKQKKFVSEEEFFAFLEKRKNLLDGVVICGGEPSIHADLPEFCAKIKAKNFLVKLDTNGSNPDMLKNLLEKKLVDYIAMDIKAPLDEYEKISGINISEKILRESIKIIIENSPNYQFRTTVIKGFHTTGKLQKMQQEIFSGKELVLQEFRNGDLVDINFC